MLYPSIDKLLKIADSKYSLVVATSKRARNIKDGSTVLIQKPKSHKFVGIALEEIYVGKLTIERIK